MISLATRIRRARTVATLSQATLARRVGVHRSAVTQWERAPGTTPSVDHLLQVATVTGVAFEWLATGRGQSYPEAGGFDMAVVIQDYANDDLESRVLSGLRRT